MRLSPDLDRMPLGAGDEDEPGLLRVVAEALARNLKVITPRVGGVVDIAEGVPGVALLERDDSQTLRTAIAEWLCAGCPRSEGGAELMRVRYSPEVVATRHMEIYREVLDSPA